ncbi:MAG: TetR/AcrR family transcriptional regulator [Sphingomonadales bacterium]|nr:TetR/AcrR family transcriptional regulator [Sphingomonadales bacterium]
MSTDSDNRQRILDAAHAIFAESGLAGLSVRAIATRAGLSTIGVYSHFKGKRGILLALYADGFARLGDAADIPPQVADGADLVPLLVNRYIDFHRDHPAHYQLMFGMDRSQLGDAAMVGSIAKASIERLAATLSRLLPGNLPADAALTVTFRVWVLMHGYVSLREMAGFRMMSDDEWRGEVIAAVRQLLSGEAH